MKVTSPEKFQNYLSKAIKYLINGIKLIDPPPPPYTLKFDK